MGCLFPTPLGSLWNTEDDVKGRVEENMAANPGCPVKVGVLHNRVARMSHSDYALAGECHAVAIGIQDNELASKLESHDIMSVVKQAGTTCINKNSTNGDGTSGIPLYTNSTCVPCVFLFTGVVCRYSSVELAGL